MQSLDRRHFLSTSAAALAVSTLPFASRPVAAAPAKPASRIKLGLATYSYWHFTRNKYPIEKVIDHAADLGVEGVDVLHMQMASEKPDYLRKLKRHAFLNGVGLIGCPVFQCGHVPLKSSDSRDLVCSCFLGWLGRRVFLGPLLASTDEGHPK